MLSKAKRQMLFGRTINKQRCFDATEEMLLEAKHKVMLYNEELQKALSEDNFAAVGVILNYVRNWTDAVIELNYDLENYKRDVNKTRKELDLPTIR